MSIYIQITTRCNMTCAHCCFACTARGHDISKADFESAIQIAKSYEQTITIGGGEPTLHPLFKDFLWHAIWELAGVAESMGNPAVYMVTNGSNTEISLTLAKLAASGVIGCAVSRDQYHDDINPAVYRAFETSKRDFYDHSHDNDGDHRHINEEPTYITPHGRAKDWGNHPYAKCNCDSLFITPLGNVFPCGCKVKKIGNVRQGEALALQYEHFEGVCGKSKDYEAQFSEVPEACQEA